MAWGGEFLSDLSAVCKIASSNFPDLRCHPHSSFSSTEMLSTVPLGFPLGLKCCSPRYHMICSLTLFKSLLKSLFFGETSPIACLKESLVILSPHAT